MHPDLPTKLYKYFEPDRIGVLTDYCVRFTPLGAFNDPFEGRPEITGVEAVEDVALHLGKIPMDEINELYESLPQDLRNSVTTRELLFMGTYLKNSQIEEVDQQLPGRESLVQAFVTRNLDNLLGAFCLSEVPDSLLMWAHYAKSHTGFVLEFDARHPYFDQRRADDDEICFVRRVRYRESRPDAYFGVLSAVELALTKSVQWMYEREWRLLRPFADASTIVEKDGARVHLFTLPPDAISAVIVGARATAETNAKLRGSLAQNPKLSHVQLKFAAPDAYHFRLRMIQGEQAITVSGRE